jgi:hypothetical protein
MIEPVALRPTENVVLQKPSSSPQRAASTRCFERPGQADPPASRALIPASPKTRFQSLIFGWSNTTSIGKKAKNGSRSAACWPSRTSRSFNCAAPAVHGGVIPRRHVRCLQKFTSGTRLGGIGTSLDRAAGLRKVVVRCTNVRTLRSTRKNLGQPFCHIHMGVNFCDYRP